MFVLEGREREGGREKWVLGKRENGGREERAGEAERERGLRIPCLGR